MACAAEEFGSAEPCDDRRISCLVPTATEVTSSRAGTVAGACKTSALREWVFRLVENRAIRAAQAMPDAARATARRCTDLVEIVAVDATSLHLTDQTGRRGLGAVGSVKQEARGHQVTSSLALAPKGGPRGLGSWSYRVREKRSRRPTKAMSHDMGRPNNDRIEWRVVDSPCVVERGPRREPIARPRPHHPSRRMGPSMATSCTQARPES